MNRAMSGRMGVLVLKLALAVVAVAYAMVRFGAHIGIAACLTAVVFLALEALEIRLDARRATLFLWLLPSLQIALVAGFFLAPPPFGVANILPATVAMQTPFLLLVLCLVAATTIRPRPWTTFAAGASALAAGYVVKPLALAVPNTLTQANIVLAHIKTGYQLLEAISVPNYFNTGIWRGNLWFVALVVAALVFGVFRTQRLARITAERQASREALSAYFSSQVVDVILETNAKGLAPQERTIAVLDCDLVGFTRLAETLAPEAVALALKTYRALVEAVVLAQEGAILCHEGDGIRAAFGLVGNAQSASAHALAAARRIADEWPATAQGLRLPETPKIAIGIDYGPARVGLIGRGRTLTLLTLGSPIEGAARIQAATRNRNRQILVGVSAAEDIARSGSPVLTDERVAVAD